MLQEPVLLESGVAVRSNGVLAQCSWVLLRRPPGEIAHTVSHSCFFWMEEIKPVEQRTGMSSKDEKQNGVK